jgi:hypothetical protein
MRLLQQVLFFSIEKESYMRNLLLAACLFSFSVSAMASCDELKSQIDAKLQAKGVTSYTLDVVPVALAAATPVAASGATAASGAAAATAPAKAVDGKVVGTCEGDTKQIVYKRN